MIEEIERLELIIPRPLPHQLEDHEAPFRFKLFRWGRRTGKTREDFIASIAGHGPGWDAGDPMFPGVLQGWDVLWIGKNNAQASQIWLEELLPRFEPIEGNGIEIMRAPDRRITIEGHGTLHLRSAEAIGSVRGLGNRLIGVICDEAAWWSWLEAWRKEIRPVLMDNKGWAIISSTTNGGPDGEVNELGDKISPSGFNRRCMEVMLGAPGFTAADNWYHSHRTARENPKIDPAEFAATCREYPPDSISLAQEMEAKLVSGGAGLAFPEWNDNVHVVRMEAPGGSVWFGGMDWGYSPDPCVYYSIASFGDRRLHYRHERRWQETTPYQVGYELGLSLLRWPWHEWIATDPSMHSKTTGKSIAEQMQEGLEKAMNPTGRGRHSPRLIPAPAGEEQRRSRKVLLHEGLRYEERTPRQIYELEGRDLEDLSEAELAGIDEPFVPEWLGPKMTWHPDCQSWIATVSQLPRHDKGKEDVDTNAYDHDYDAGTYPLTARIAQDREDRRDRPSPSRDTHPGFTADGRRVDPYQPPKPNTDAPFRSGIRWRYGHRNEERHDDEE